MRSIILCLLSVVFSLVASACHQDTGKQNLKVLYVGNDPGRELPPRNFANGAGIAEGRYEADMKGRMPAFEEFLKQYFTKVKTVDANDYREEMTKDYDVVVFDALPHPVVPGIKQTKQDINVMLLPESTRKKLESSVDTKELLSACYFSEDYSKPTLLLGDKAGILGGALGLKLNWFCRCLDAHAYDVEVEHPIFHEPLAVELSYEKRIAPTSAMSGIEGVATPGVMDMWRVQTEGYREGGRDRYRQGLVAFGDGFEENGDGERIAGGVSDKYRSAVSIGRHGNFMMWGFAADPSLMTEDARRVLVNAICYISKFDGQKPVTRKYENGYVTRDKIRRELALFEDGVFEKYEAGRKTYNEKLMDLKREVEELRAAGEEVAGDLMSQAWPQPQRVVSRDAFLDSYLKYEGESLGYSNMTDYGAYLKENLDYFYGGKGNFKFVVDKDLKSLRVPVGDVKGLDRFIALLEGTPEEKAMGERLLERYTMEDFTTAPEWKEWLNRVREKLIFTESCGYKFVDKDKGMKITRKEESSVSGMQQKNPVKVFAHRTGNEIRVQFTMEKGFHIYAASGEEGAYILTGVEFEYPNGIRAAGKMICPEGEEYEADPKVRIYKDKVTFIQPITVDPENNKGVVTYTVTYQACDETICLPPVTEEKEVLNL